MHGSFPDDKIISRTPDTSPPFRKPPLSLFLTAGAGLRSELSKAAVTKETWSGKFGMPQTWDMDTFSLRRAGGCEKSRPGQALKGNETPTTDLAKPRGWPFLVQGYPDSDILKTALVMGMIEPTAG